MVASSVAAFGFAYAPKAFAPDYLPLDESHPCKPQDPYGLSKIFGEKIADYFVALSNITVASLRLAGINFDLSYQTFIEQWKDPGARARTFWSYIDARDAAVACKLGIETDFAGHEIFNIAAPTSRMKEPTTKLIQRYIPEFKGIKGSLTGNWSGLDSSKAENLLGFKAQHVWEKYLR